MTHAQNNPARKNPAKSRSWLFAPGDSERKLAKVPGCGADVVIVDLEDAVAPPNKARARGLAAEWLADHPGAWVRINPLSTDLWQADLAAVLPAAPAGIMLPKAAGPAEVAQLATAIADGAGADAVTGILPLVSETAAAALTIPAYAGDMPPGLTGLTWGAEDLSAVLGATRKRDDRGNWTDAFRLIRAQLLLTAHACDVLAIETLFADFKDLTGLARIAAASYADGFAGMLAIHPDQVPIINAAFSPSPEQLAEARAIIAAFEAEPGAGAVQLDGRMLDQPHLVLARRLLARAD
ncbi:HpcH/HpaI aldolase/citrate lyase family protein [Croceibacterium ferulae]|uniref:HpcH/HpaI aldolase/citrate lyase family protein n=1 Tax=Croceibacterium ferulae TaxID=1854641 RepID=UPI000EAE3676|nr:CoA ester lyase [Croceibacterium ferulae]